MNKFTIIPGDNFIWNEHELLKFLVDNQGKDIILYTKEEGCSAESIGLYKLLDIFQFRSVLITTTNSVEHHDRYKINITNSDKFFKNLSTEDYSQYHKWNKTKIFGLLYNRAIWHRIGLASYMHQMHTDMSLLNFRSNPNNEDDRKLFELQTLFEIHPESLINFTNSKFPILLEKTDGYTVGATTQQHTDQLAQFYTNFLIDIVAETFTTGRTFFPTEKTVRPMLSKKPFIVMGPKCFLIHLRQMGFKTFYEFWDEDYDGWEKKERYIRIIKLIDFLSQKPISELYDMYQDMQHILNHNYNLLKSQTYYKKIKYVE